jgi:hypothetical protein
MVMLRVIGVGPMLRDAGWLYRTEYVLSGGAPVVVTHPDWHPNSARAFAPYPTVRSSETELAAPVVSDVIIILVALAAATVAPGIRALRIVAQFAVVPQFPAIVKVTRDESTMSPRSSFAVVKS